MGRVGAYLWFRSGLQEDMTASLFSICVPFAGKVALYLPGLGAGPPTPGKSSPTSCSLFPSVAGPEPGRGKGVVRIAKLLPGRERSGGGLPAPFSAASTQFFSPLIPAFGEWVPKSLRG